MSVPVKFAVQVEGHAATVELTMDGKGGFTGTITSPEFGTGAITNGKCLSDGGLEGDVALDGYDADFSATLTGNQITGSVSYLFFSKNFIGTETA